MFVVAHELWPRKVLLDGPVLGSLAIVVLLVLLPHVAEIEVPGFGKVTLREAESTAKRVRARSELERAAQGVDQDVARQLQLGDLASRLVDQQPLSAIIALRSELEQKIEDVYRGLYAERPDSPVAALNRMARDGFLDGDQFQLGVLLLAALDKTVHSASVSESTARDAVSLGEAFADSLARPRLTEALTMQEQVFRILDSVEDLEYQREPTAGRGRQRADFLARRGDEQWIGEIKWMDATRDLSVQRRLAVDQLDNVLKVFATTQGVLVVQDGVPLPAKSVISRSGGVTITFVALSELRSFFEYPSSGP